MDEIYTRKNLNYSEKAVKTETKERNSFNEADSQPSEKAITTILNYSKSLAVLKSKNSENTKLCNIN